MAQGGCAKAIERYRDLTGRARSLLATELARTGLVGQSFTYAPDEAFGGPAFLVYYGPALLQRCQDDEKQMQMALLALAAVYRAGRFLWPATTDSQGDAVTLEIGQLKSRSIEQVFCCAPDEQRAIWIMLKLN